MLAIFNRLEFPHTLCDLLYPEFKKLKKLNRDIMFEKTTIGHLLAIVVL